MSDYGLVYCATNKINNKKYIGQTTMILGKRISGHIKTAIYDNKRSVYFHNALNKYGKDVFEWSVLMYARNKEELDYWEDYIIREEGTIRPNGYNLKYGGSHGKYSLESRIKMSMSRKRYFKKHPEAKEELSAIKIAFFFRPC